MGTFSCPPHLLLQRRRGGSIPTVQCKGTGRSGLGHKSQKTTGPDDIPREVLNLVFKYKHSSHIRQRLLFPPAGRLRGNLEAAKAASLSKMGRIDGGVAEAH